MTDPPARLRQALAARYSIERQLGEGGMATVYLAEDLKHERKVALKVLKPELAAAVGAERFLAEIKTTANLQHPNILPLFDSGEADGFLYYVMPHVAGESLRERIDRDHQLPIDDAVAIATGVAEALHYAHRAGVVHRDIKPGNILLQDGKPVVADFGIALALSAGGVDRVTQTGTSLGTPQYMSPEQAAGDPSVGPASDIYSLGCVLYEMLVGDPPYIGSTPQAILGKVISGTLATPTSQRGTVPANVDAAVRKALERVAGDRFSSPAEFANALADPDFRYGAMAVAADQTLRRWRLTALVAGVAAVSAVGALAFGLATARADRGTPEVVRFDIPVDPDGIAQLGAVSETAYGRPARRSFAFSPDGETLAYEAWWRNADGDLESTIFVRRLEQEVPTPLDFGDDPKHPFFSPDGDWLGFYQGGTIRRRFMRTGDVETVVTGGVERRGFGWSDRGEILFIRENQLMRVDDAGGDPRPVEFGTEEIGAGPEGVLSHPLPVPGSSLVLVSVLDFYLEYDSEIWAVDVETGAAHRVVENAMASALTSAGHLLFMREGTLLAVPFETDSGRTSGSPVVAMDDVMHSTHMPNSVQDVGDGHFSVSSRGHLAYLSGGAYPAASRAVIRVSPTGAVDTLDLPLSDWRRVRVSPGGDVLAVAQVDPEGDRRLVLYDLEVEGGRPRLLDTGGVSVNRWAWSADGSEIVYSAREGGTFHRQPIDGGEPLAVVPDSLVSRAATLFEVVRDSDALLVRDGGDVFTVDNDGSVARVLDLTGAVGYPTVSSDQRWLAYRASGPGGQQVYIRSFGQGSASPPIRVSNAGGGQPAWSPDGTRLYYSTLGTATIDLYWVDVTPEGPGPPQLLAPAVPMSSHNPGRGYDVGAGGYLYGPGYADQFRADLSVSRIKIVLDFVRDLEQRLAEPGVSR